jgi:hypothetical protein
MLDNARHGSCQQVRVKLEIEEESERGEERRRTGRMSCGFAQIHDNLPFPPS